MELSTFAVMMKLESSRLRSIVAESARVSVKALERWVSCGCVIEIIRLFMNMSPGSYGIWVMKPWFRIEPSSTGL